MAGNSHALIGRAGYGRIWQTATGKETHELTGGTEAISPIPFSPTDAYEKREPHPGEKITDKRRRSTQCSPSGIRRQAERLGNCPSSDLSFGRNANYRI